MMRRAGRGIGWALGLLVALGLACGAPGAARASESPAVSSKRATATLVSDTDAVAPGVPFQVALRLRMAPGWHTYWRNPGDAGVPADLAFTLPPGMTAGPVVWPAPGRQPEGDLMTYGYSGSMLLPVTLSGGASAGAAIRLHASWLVCGTICVPEEGDFALDLPPGTPAPSAQAPLFAEAALRTPRPSPWSARFSPDGTLSVATGGLAPAAVRDAWFMPDAAGAIDITAPQHPDIRDGAVLLRLKPLAGRKPPLSGVLAIADRSGQTSFFDITAPDGPALASDAPGPGLVDILAAALLGGLILNLMPCVFPVLAMKAVGLARLSGVHRGHARTHAIAYAAGVIATFLALGAGLLALRAAGSAAGWGFQFQSPAFVGLMALLLFAVGLNLSGVYQIGGGIAGAGQSLAGRRGMIGSFCTGLLAVLVATPCTAPFMATAIAAALGAPSGVTLGVFAMLGVGLAAPYVLLACLPGLNRALPRPGAWMEVLRQALAFPMYGAALWLVWVVSQEAGPAGVLASGGGILLAAFAAWLLGLTQQNASAKLRRAGRTVSLAAVVAGCVLIALTASSAGPAPAATAGAEAFTPARLAALRAEGKPVFVNMTAAWCVTCLVNERVALAPAPVRAAFAAHGVAYLKGDWTRANPDITAFLRAHARDGVPLYVMYPSGNHAPEVLPQILTEGIVLAAIAGS
jgi:thiol:disulfide interchange protein DsbD